MNFVYVVGTGSHWQDNELRFSLRSLSNVPGKHEVMVIGHAPEWLTNVTLVPLRDVGNDPVMNVTVKLTQAIPYLPDRFALMNDDFFVMRAMEAIPVLHLGPMEPRLRYFLNRRNPYMDAFRRSYEVLRSMGVREPLNFSVHTPFLVERGKLMEMSADWPLGKCLFKTIYGNQYCRSTAMLARDVKTNIWNGRSVCWSTPNHLLPGAKAILQRRFRQRCEYEKP